MCNSHDIRRTQRWKLLRRTYLQFIVMGMDCGRFILRTDAHECAYLPTRHLAPLTRVRLLVHCAHSAAGPTIILHQVIWYHCAPHSGTMGTDALQSGRGLNCINLQAVIKFWQNCIKQEVKH
jgi:hypothetical protein